MDAQAFLKLLGGVLFASPLTPFLGVGLVLALLPLPGRYRDRLVPAVLALLWLGQAAALARAGAGPDHVGAWLLALLALAQAVLLLSGGTLGKAFPFRPASEGRTVMGGGILLVVLCAATLGVLREPAVLNAPPPLAAFPLAAATLAVLLVGAVPRRPALWAGTIPLLWTATAWLGLLPMEAGRAAILLAGFLAGFLLVWPEWDQAPELVPGARLLGELERGRSLAWQGWFTGLALGLVLLARQLLPQAPRQGLLLVNEEVALRTDRTLVQLALSLAVVAAFVAAAWLPAAAWDSPAFRALAFGGARTAGAARRWLGAGWHPAALIVAGGVVSYAVLHGMMDWTGATVRGWLQDELVLVLVTLTVLALLVRWLRRRICIAEIEIAQVGDETEAKEWGKALAARLRNELGSLAALFRTIDEALPARQGRSMGLELAVENVAGQLEQALGQEISVGPMALKIPFSGLLSRASGLWKGPRLTGTLHRVGEEGARRLVLTADVSGGGRRMSWRVTQDDLPECERAGDERQVAYCLVRQLAFRVLTAMTSAGSPRWEAVQAFTAGLRAYRAVQRTDVDYQIELRKAEASLLEALRLDQHFDDCHYNLGIVYARLRDYNAAEAAFRQAIAESPDHADAYLGLTLVYLHKDDFLRAEVWAEQALSLRPGSVRAWNFVGVARFLDLVKERRKPEERRRRATTPEDWDPVIRGFRATAALAWRDHCRAELAGTLAERRETRRWVAMTFNNLAEAHLERRALECQATGVPDTGPPRGVPFLREGLRAVPREPYLHLALGKGLAQAALPVTADAAVDRSGRREALEEAQAALYLAGDDGLGPDERCHRWMWLLQVHAALLDLNRRKREGEGEPDPGREEEEHRDGAVRSLRCFLHAVAAPQDLVLAPTTRAEDSRREEYLENLKTLEKDLLVLPVVPGLEGRYRPEYLRALVAEARAVEAPDAPPETPPAVALETEDRTWLDAQRALREVRAELAQDAPGNEDAVKKLESLIGTLNDCHSRQVGRQGLDSLLAKACLLAAQRRTDPADRAVCLRKALAYGARGVASNPEDPGRRLVMSQIYVALADFEMADRERTAALNFALPDDLFGDGRLLSGLEAEWQERLLVADGDGSRQAALAGASRFLDRLLGVVDNAPLAARDDGPMDEGPTHFDRHAGLHLAAGKLAAAAGDWRRAIDHLRIAVGSGHELGESAVRLARALGEVGLLEEAADVLERHTGAAGDAADAWRSAADELRAARLAPGQIRWRRTIAGLAGHGR